MWKRGIARMSEMSGGTARRRGARLGLVVALLAVVPGLVAGTAFISGTSGTTLQGTPQTAGQWCGFAKSPAIMDAAYLGTITQTGQVGATALYSSTTFQPQIRSTGTGGFEYLDGEFDIGCSGTPSTGPITLTVTETSSVAFSGGTVSQSIVFIEFPGPTSGTPPANAPDYKYCAPNAASGAYPNAADQPSSTGTCTGTTIAATECATTAVYLPNDGDVAATSWWAYNMVGGTQACPTQASFSSTSTQAVALSLGTTVDYYGAVSFAIYQSAATSVTGSFTLTVVTTG